MKAGTYKVVVPHDYMARLKQVHEGLISSSWTKQRSRNLIITYTEQPSAHDVLVRKSVQDVVALNYYERSVWQEGSL